MQLYKIFSEHYHWWSVTLVILHEISFKNYLLRNNVTFETLSLSGHYTAIA